MNVCRRVRCRDAATRATNATPLLALRGGRLRVCEKPRMGTVAQQFSEPSLSPAPADVRSQLYISSHTHARARTPAEPNPRRYTRARASTPAIRHTRFQYLRTDTRAARQPATMPAHRGSTWKAVDGVGGWWWCERQAVRGTVRPTTTATNDAVVIFPGTRGPNGLAGLLLAGWLAAGGYFFRRCGQSVKHHINVPHGGFFLSFFFA